MQVSPVPSTTHAVLMTSPECRMFSSTQRINVARGFYSFSDYNIAVARIRFMRRLHASWRKAAREDQLPRMSIHEQPPGARMDLPLKKKQANAWPWAVGRTCLRATVNGCMIGMTGRSSKRLFKGYTFETDSQHTRHALTGFRCSRRHDHDTTTLRPSGLTSIKQHENYPNSMAALLTHACGSCLL
jgi:hypothetical protein